jgi:hypothetical protein
MNIQQQSESIANQRQCSNAKPPINHDIKYAEEADIKDQIAKFLASGREIEQVAGIGNNAKQLTYKERNDSTFVSGVK